MKTLLLLLLFTLLHRTAVFAGKRDSTVVRQIVVKYVDDGLNLITYPFRWDTKDWLIASGTSIATVSSIFFFDKLAYDYLNTKDPMQFKHAISALEYSDMVGPAAIISGFAIVGAIKKNNYTMNTALIVTESFVMNGIMVKAVKYLAGRKRPNATGGDPLQWNMFSGASSFYSGHTSTAFATASVIAYRYKDTKWVPWLCYGIAGLTGVQRVFFNKHYVSDVLIGAVVGTSTGIFLSKAWENHPIKFYPQFGGGVKGIGMVIKLK